MNCVKCGAENVEGAKFCKECGTEIIAKKKGKSKIIKRVIIISTIAIVLFCAIFVAVKKISFSVTMGDDKNVRNYYGYGLRDVEKIVTQRALEEDAAEYLTKSFYDKNGVCLAKIAYNEDGYCQSVKFYDNRGNCIVEADNSAGRFMVTGITEYEYEAGKIATEKHYTSDGSADYYSEYSYDGRGNLESVDTYTNDFWGNMFSSSKDYDNTYVSGKLSQTTMKVEEHTYTCKYNSNGAKVAEAYTCEYGCSLQWNKTYEYENGILIMETRNSLGNNGKLVTSEKLYDETTGRLERINYYSNKEYSSSDRYEYDWNGDLSYIADEDWNTRYTYSTEYVNGNVKIRLEQAAENPLRYVANIERVN